MIRSLALVLFIFLSCTHKDIQSKVSDADRIEVIDLESGFSYTDTSAVMVQLFKDVLAGTPQPTDCSPQGRVLFKKGDKTKLDIGYYKDASACSFLIMDKDNQKTGYRLSHDALVYLGRYFQDLKKQHHARSN